MSSGRDLFFHYIQQDDQENALKVLKHIRCFTENDGNYAIRLASSKGFAELVKQLLRYGADPYALNKNNENALSIANRSKFNDVMEAIYRSKCDITTNIGVYLLDAVANNDFKEVLLFCQKAEKARQEEIISAAMRLWTKGQIENSMLHLAYMNGNEEMVKLLIRYGADTRYQNQRGQIPSDLSPSQLQQTSPRVQSRTNEESRGRDKQKYMDFIEYLQTTETNLDAMDTLGNWDSHNPEYYFVQSDESTQYAKEILSHYWTNKRNVQLAIDYHQLKFGEEKKRKQDIEDLFPSCISFIAATLNGKRYCFIALSITDESEVTISLKEFIEEYNKTKNDIEFVLLSGMTLYMNEVFRKISENNYRPKHCAEKSCIKFLTKLYLEHGESLQVNGVSNCTFYPYQQDESYGRRAYNPLNRTVGYQFIRKNHLSLNDKTYVGLQPCCRECQNNKRAVAKILKGAQDYNVNFDKMQREGREQRNLELSPVRNSIKTDSSLLQTFSSFQKTRNKEHIHNAHMSGIRKSSNV